MDARRPKNKLHDFRPHQLGQLQGPVHQVSFYQMTERNGTCGTAGLLEVDVWTGQPHQPWVNHRDLDVKSYKEHTRNDDGSLQPPMIHSIVKPDEKSLFSNGDAISCTICQIEEIDDSTLSEEVPMSCRLKACREFTLQSEEGGLLKTGSSTIRNRRVVPVTVAGIQRFLKFWNQKWVTKSRGPVVKNSEQQKVTLQVLASLVKLLDIPLTTEDDFRGMLEKFQFEGLYQYNASIGLEGNRQQFFALMRAFSPLRLGVFDGKHRMFGMMNVSQGIYDISNEIKNGTPHQVWESVNDFAGIPKDQVKCDQMQCFTSQQILVGKAVQARLRTAIWVHNSN